jgi:hypothetical protein
MNKILSYKYFHIISCTIVPRQMLKLNETDGEARERDERKGKVRRGGERGEGARGRRGRRRRRRRRGKEEE